MPGADEAPRQQFPNDPARSIETALAGGGLDHDGVGDLLTESGYFVSAGPMPWAGVADYRVAPQLHVYYGVPAIARVH